MSQPIALDLYCCQGGATRGLQDAGFYVIGVDKDPQPNYCGDEFVQADVIEFMRRCAFDGMIYLPGKGRRPFTPALVHASPPCQGGTNAQKIQKREHPRLIGPTRELLIKLGVPYVIENVVPGPELAHLDPLIDPIMLCGTMFGLHTYRHRLFEASFPLVAPPHPEHVQQQVKMGRPIKEGDFYQAVGNFSGVRYAARDMGVEWMTRDGIRECIPPAYSREVARQFLAGR